MRTAFALFLLLLLSFPQLLFTIGWEISIIGIPVGIFSLTTYGFSLGFAHILSSVLVTYWWQEYHQVQWSKRKVVLVAVGVFVLLKVVTSIPILGWLISAVVVAITFGAILAELLRKKGEPEEMAPIEVEEMQV